MSRKLDDKRQMAELVARLREKIGHSAKKAKALGVGKAILSEFKEADAVAEKAHVLAEKRRPARC